MFYTDGCSIHLQKENKLMAYGNICEHSGCVGTECIRVVEGNEPFWHRGKNFKRRLFLEDLGRALVSLLIQKSVFPGLQPVSAWWFKHRIPLQETYLTRPQHLASRGRDVITVAQKTTKPAWSVWNAKLLLANHMLPSLLSAFVRMRKAHGYECLFILFMVIFFAKK